MGKVRRTILGSVSDYLVHHAHCPVVVCRHPSKSRHASGNSETKVKSRHVSGSEVDKRRHASGDVFKKSRHASGDSSSFRARLASWGKSFSFSEEHNKEDKENRELTPENVEEKK